MRKSSKTAVEGDTKNASEEREPSHGAAEEKPEGRAMRDGNSSESDDGAMLDLEFIQSAIALTSDLIEAGARTFAEYVIAMENALGDQFVLFKPHLKSWYSIIKFDPDAEGFEMDSINEVDAADIDYIIYKNGKE